jgi:hypothetical protein
VCVSNKVILIKQFLLSLARTASTLFQPDCGANLVIPVRNVQHREPGDNIQIFSVIRGGPTMSINDAFRLCGWVVGADSFTA